MTIDLIKKPEEQCRRYNDYRNELERELKEGHGLHRTRLYLDVGCDKCEGYNLMCNYYDTQQDGANTHYKKDKTIPRGSYPVETLRGSEEEKGE